MRRRSRWPRLPLAAVIVWSGITIVGSTAKAASSLTFVGKLSGANPATSLLIVAEDGSAVRAVPGASGAFSVSVPSKLLERFGRNPGPSVQVVSYGYYVGPVSLGGGNVWRLKDRLSGTIDLGTVKVTEKGGTATTSASLVDRRSLRLNTKFDRSKLSGKNDIWSSTAGDNDGDGIPNMFDRDSDGNGVVDGAQMSLDWKVGAKDVAKLNSKNVMSRSFGTGAQIEARLQEWKPAVPINTNVDPNATLEQLQAYQESVMNISVGSSLENGIEAFFDCSGNYFCSSDGIVPVLADQGNSKGDYGHFDNALTLLGTGKLTPDGITGILIRKKGGVVQEQYAATVRGAVASPLVIKTAGGVAQKYPLTRDTASIGGASLSALTIEFYRPQELQTKPRLFMADRGGFIYSISISFNGPPFVCKAANVQPSKQLIPISNSWDKGRSGQQYFDYDASPKNGELLSLTVDVWGCLKNPVDGATAPSDYSGMTIRLEARDWAGNSASGQLQLP